MTTIFFIKGQKAYLPEVDAYADFAKARGYRVEVLQQTDQLPSNPEVIWFFCGLPQSLPKHVKNKPFIIHEYASASVGTFASFKDRVKRILFSKADYRIFLNEWVKESLGFEDEIPFEYRDMGVPQYFFEAGNKLSYQQRKASANFELVYVGETSRLAYFWPVLKVIEQLNLSLAIVGEVEAGLKKKLRRLQNVTLTGRVKQCEVCDYLAKSRVGLNLIPNSSPYNQQTSTKLIEYCAAKLPVISNDYPWAREFTESGAKSVFLFDEDCKLASFKQAFEKAIQCSDKSLEDSQSLVDTWQEKISNLTIWHSLPRP